jgi:hypothetical protein
MALPFFANIPWISLPLWEGDGAARPAPRHLFLSVPTGFATEEGETRGEAPTHPAGLSRPHLRTSNVVESLFATVRLRTTAAKRFKKVDNATALIWKLLQIAESTFRRFKGAELLPAEYAGAQYVNGVPRIVKPQQRLAA